MVQHNRRYDTTPCDTIRQRCVLTHGVPHVDVALASPVVALRKRLPIGEHVAFVSVGTLSETVVVQPGRPVVHVARVQLSISCSETGRRERSNILSHLNLEISFFLLIYFYG